jgi:hypothetical protein
MWKLYASQDDSICIQSTHAKLQRLLPHDCFLGTVKYIDYNKDYIDPSNALHYITHKRKSFEHERELRAVLWTPTAKTTFGSADGRGLVVPIDLGELVDAIFISPSSEPILEGIVRGLNQTYGLGAPIHKSQVEEPPDY